MRGLGFSFKLRKCTLKECRDGESLVKCSLIPSGLPDSRSLIIRYVRLETVGGSGEHQIHSAGFLEPSSASATWKQQTHTHTHIHTGNLGRIVEPSYVSVCGALKDTIIPRGLWV